MTEPNKIRAMADEAHDNAMRLKAELALEKDADARKKLRLRIKTCKMIEGWCRTRAGYR